MGHFRTGLAIGDVEESLVERAVRWSDVVLLNALMPHVPDSARFLETVAEVVVVRALDRAAPGKRGCRADTWAMVNWAIDQGARFTHHRVNAVGRGTVLDMLVCLPWSPQGPLARWLARTEARLSEEGSADDIEHVCETALHMGQLEVFRRAWPLCGALRDRGRRLLWERPQGQPLIHMALTTVVNRIQADHLPPPYGAGTLKAFLRSVVRVADVQACDAQGNSVLHHLMLQVGRMRPLWKGRTPDRRAGWVALMLEARGADPWRLNGKGQTAVDLAEQALPELAAIWRAQQAKRRLDREVPQSSTSGVARKTMRL